MEQDFDVASLQFRVEDLEEEREEYIARIDELESRISDLEGELEDEIEARQNAEWEAENYESDATYDAAYFKEECERLTAELEEAKNTVVGLCPYGQPYNDAEREQILTWTAQ